MEIPGLIYMLSCLSTIPCDIPQDVSNWMKKSFYYADSVEHDYLDNAAFFGGESTWEYMAGDDFINFGLSREQTVGLDMNPIIKVRIQVGWGFYMGLKLGMNFILSIHLIFL